jgi:predicted NBD/HSP70 family sugar kinase
VSNVAHISALHSDREQHPLTDFHCTTHCTDAVDRARHGRPAATLCLAASPGVVVGLDFGHSHLRAAVGDLAGQVLAEEYHELRVDNSPDDAVAAAAREFNRLLGRIQAAPADVTSVVMSLPSLIDQDSGRVVSNNILPGWINRTPAHDLQQRIHLPVLLDNDANLAALGQITYAAADGVRNFICVKASTGIGTGLVFDGHLYRGDTGTAAELGHVQIQPEGAICRCGNCGCLETLVSVPHVLASLQPMHREPLTITHVIRLIAAGDVSARRVVTDAGRAIAALSPPCATSSTLVRSSSAANSPTPARHSPAASAKQSTATPNQPPLTP